jgi:hypothetical protein
MPQERASDELYYVYGLNGSTGTYLDDPLTYQEVGDAARKQIEKPSAVEARILKKRIDLSQPSMALVLGIDERELGSAGWGIIFAKDADPSIKDALQPLLDHRQEQAGALFQVYEGDNGYLPRDTWESFRLRHQVKSGLAKPSQMPYYLLIVGDPETIPYDFQYLADVERAVGRIHFDRLEDYAYYAHGVVMAEDGCQPLQLPRSATFFGTSNPDDRATKLSSELLVKPLAEELAGVLQQHKWNLDIVDPKKATKAQLSELLGGSATPSLLFTVTHGAAFDKSDRFYPVHQGALVTQDWPGPRNWRERLEEEFFLSAEDISSDASLWGMIAVFFACFGAGTPQLNDYYHLKQRRPDLQVQLAEQALLAPLPQRLLSHSNGGALAVVGHVERAWSASFKGRGTGPDSRDLQAFEQLFSLLIRGYPLGAALEDMSARYAQNSIQLTKKLYPVLHQGMNYTDDLRDEVAWLWTANNDARNYIIVGDPAVRLPVSATQAKMAEHPTLPPIEISVSSKEESSKPETGPQTSFRQEPESVPDVDGAQGESLWIPGRPPAGLRDDAELLAFWREHIKAGYKHNDEMFRRILKAFLGPYHATVWMYGIVFAIGILSFLSAIVLSVWLKQAVYALAFCGLTATAFLGYFVGRPLQSLEENLEFITWLGIIYNTYWTQVAAVSKPDTTQQDLQTITNDTIAALEYLIDKHAEMSGRRFKLWQ